MDNLPKNLPVKSKKTGSISGFTKTPNTDNKIDLQNVSISQLIDEIKKINPDKVEGILKDLFKEINDHVGDYHNPHRVTLDQLAGSPIEDFLKRLLVGSVSNKLVPSYVVNAEEHDITSGMSKYTDEKTVSKNFMFSGLKLFTTSEDYKSVSNDNCKCVDYEHLPVIYNSGESTVYKNTDYTVKTNNSSDYINKTKVDFVDVEFYSIVSLDRNKVREVTITTEIDKSLNCGIYTSFIIHLPNVDNLKIFVNIGSNYYSANFTKTKDLLSTVITGSDECVVYTKHLTGNYFKVICLTQIELSVITFILTDVVNTSLFMKKTYTPDVSKLTFSGGAEQIITIGGLQSASREIPFYLCSENCISSDTITLKTFNPEYNPDLSVFKSAVIRTTNIPQHYQQNNYSQKIPLGDLVLVLQNMWDLSLTNNSITLVIDVFRNDKSILPTPIKFINSNFDSSIFVGLVPNGTQLLIKTNGSKEITYIDILDSPIKLLTLENSSVITGDLRLHSIETYNSYISDENEIDFLNNYFSNTITL